MIIQEMIQILTLHQQYLLASPISEAGIWINLPDTSAAPFDDEMCILGLMNMAHSDFNGRHPK